MARCSVVVSLVKRGSVGRGVYLMDSWMRMMRPPPPVGPGRSRRMVV